VLLFLKTFINSFFVLCSNRRATQAQQQQQQLEQQHQQKQEEETFTAVGQLNLGKYYMQIRVTVNVKTKSIDFMDVDWQ
jgi:hypothetical protein